MSSEIEKEVVQLAIELQETLESIRADFASIKRSLTSIEKTFEQASAKTQSMLADLAAWTEALNSADNADGPRLH